MLTTILILNGIFCNGSIFNAVFTQNFLDGLIERKMEKNLQNVMDDKKIE